MAYTRDWTETNPIDHTKFKDVPGWIRNKCIDIAERLKNMFYGFTAGETTEGVKYLRFYKQESAPSTAADFTMVHATDIDGVVHLKVLKENGEESFLDGFWSGFCALSASTSVPADWTDLTDTYNERYLRVSTASPLDTGGSATHDHGGVTEGHALTADENGPHTHTIDTYCYNMVIEANKVSCYNVDTKQGSSAATNSSGSGTAHTHPITEADTAPLYLDLRLFKKN